MDELLQRVDRLIEVMTRVAESNEMLIKTILAAPIDDVDQPPPRREVLMDGTVIEH